MEFLKTLNLEQKKAVTHKEGPLLIVAGAGTGKTTVITQRLAWLIDQKKANPDEILALTFTEKAAGEMEERVDKLLPYGYVDLWVSTFHSFGERILRDYALEIGLDSGFQILSSAEQWLLIQQNLDQFELDYYKPLGNPARFIQALIQHFSRVKDENILPEEYLKYAQALNKKKNLKPDQREEAEKTLEAAKAYKKYQELLNQNGYFDFGDLIIRTLELFQKRKTVLEKFRKQFKYILVDEFQDTNHAQYELLKLLAYPKNNLTVVGDDDQAIYRFRGASMSNILEFKKDFPQSEDVVLVKNYRSKQNILDLSYQFIQLNNPNRLEHQLKKTGGKSPKIKRVSKKLLAQSKGKAVIKHLESETEEDEVLDVLREILKLKNKDPELTWNDFAILVRANHQADIFVKTFINQEVPYQYVAARGLYQQPEILDLIAWLRMLDNYHESPSLFRVLSLEAFNIDTRDLIRILNFTNRKRCSLYETLEKIDQVYYLQKKTKEMISFILDLIKKQTQMAKEKSVGQVAYEFLRSIGYLKRLTSKEDPDYHKKIQNISKFFKKIQEFEKSHAEPTVKNFMAELRLVIDIGEDPAPALGLEEGPDSVKIMTVHGAKGLEFPHVFVANLVDKRFPSMERREQIEVPSDLIKEILPEGDVHLQEERRLFYVACTRAKEGLYFTSALDVGGKTKKKPSRFLYEVKVKKEEKEKPSEQLNLGFDIVKKKSAKKEKIHYPLPERFSFSQFKAYETCPKQYKYMFIWKVPVLAGRHTYSFGSSVHNTLHAFYALIQQGENPSKGDLLKLYEANWIDDWYDSKQHEQERKKSGAKMLEEFYEKNKRNFKPPEFLEKGFNLKVGEYSVRGFIDRVDRIGRETVEIIDYKTGKKPQAKSQIDHNQLLIYYLAMKEVFQKEAALLSFYYTDGNEKYSFTADEEGLKKLKAKIKKNIKEIREGDFTATPSQYKCASCDFREICEERVV